MSQALPLGGYVGAPGDSPGCNPFMRGNDGGGGDGDDSVVAAAAAAAVAIAMIRLRLAAAAAAAEEWAGFPMEEEEDDRLSPAIEGREREGRDFSL